MKWVDRNSFVSLSDSIPNVTIRLIASVDGGEFFMTLTIDKHTIYETIVCETLDKAKQKALRVCEQEIYRRQDVLRKAMWSIRVGEKL